MFAYGVSLAAPGPRLVALDQEHGITRDGAPMTDETLEVLADKPNAATTSRTSCAPAAADALRWARLPPPSSPCGSTPR